MHLMKQGVSLDGKQTALLSCVPTGVIQRGKGKVDPGPSCLGAVDGLT